jgi:Zn-dependent peptidase ImmA (M78 family)/DNA-binding XRE family transcriptional regulator
VHTAKNSGFQHDRLLEARMARGLSQLELAKLLGVKRQSLSAYEKGLTIPKTEIIDKVARELHFEFDYFFRYAEDVVLDAVNFRKNKTAKEKIYSALQIRILWMIRFFNYLQQYVDFIPLNSARKEDEEYSEAEIENIAEEARRYWGLGLGPISNMSTLLENNGFVLAKFDIDLEGIDACSTTLVSQGAARHFVCLASYRSNIEKSMVRMRLDEAHEYGHYVLHSSFSRDYVQQHYDRIENEAKYFATAFLLPPESFGREARSLTNAADFLKLKERWKVSVQAMAYRCRELGIISECTYKYLCRQISANGWRKQEPFDDEWDTERTRTLREALEIVVEHGITTPVRIREELNIPAEELATMCDVEVDYFLPNSSPGKIIQFRPLHTDL